MLSIMLLQQGITRLGVIDNLMLGMLRAAAALVHTGEASIALISAQYQAIFKTANQPFNALRPASKYLMLIYGADQGCFILNLATWNWDCSMSLIR